MLAVVLVGTAGFGQDTDIAKLEKQRCPRPTEFIIVFSNGYAPDDEMPAEKDRFEALLKKIKDGGFNTIHCTYSDDRIALCKKHGIKMMVHLLAAEHHVYKSPEKARAVCEKLKGNPDVWGYNIWNDGFNKTGEGRRRDVNTVRQWDPTHPAFSGTYRVDGMSHLANADAFGYYDFHWKRGIGYHFPHLLSYSKWANERDAWFYTWLATDSGLVGKGNYNRSLYSANTSIACGLKGIMWFLGTSLMDKKTQEWTEAGKDIMKVNAEILPLQKEIALLGNPKAIYSTAITKTENDKPVATDKGPVYPGGLDKNAVPKDFWLQPASGEFMFGVFSDDKKQDCVYLANHNAYAEQKVELKLSKARKVSQFNRKMGKWQDAEVKDNTVRLTLEAGGGELLRFGE